MGKKLLWFYCSLLTRCYLVSERGIWSTSTSRILLATHLSSSPINAQGGEIVDAEDWRLPACCFAMLGRLYVRDYMLLCCCCCLRVMIRAEARSSVRVSSAIPLFLISSPAYCELLKSFHSTIYPSSDPRSRTFSRNSIDLFSPQSPYASIARCLRFYLLHAAVERW